MTQTIREPRDPAWCMNGRSPDGRHRWIQRPGWRRERCCYCRGERPQKERP